MNAMKTILLPTDFSDNARKAATYALNLFGTESAKYIVVHANLSLPYHSPLISNAHSRGKADFIKSVNDSNQFLKKDMDPDSVNYEVVINRGATAEVISNSVQKHQIDYVVMGAKGMGEIQSAMGSNTVEVLKNVNYPIIVVPEISNLREPLNIVIAIENEELQSLNYIGPLIDIAKRFDSHIYVLHIITDTRFNKELFLKLKTNLSHYLADVKYDFKSVHSVEVIGAVLEYVRKGKCELLAMIAHRHLPFCRSNLENDNNLM